MTEYFEDDDWADDEMNTVSCPNCDEQIYDDAEQCPYCQNYVVFDQSRRFSSVSKILVWILIAALVLPAIIAMLNLL